VPETVAEILKAYQTGDATPADIVARSFARLRAHDDPAMFISLREENDVLAEAQALARGGDKSLPLYGIPVAVKDNIDAAGLPTTAACPAFLYSPRKDAAAVARLRAAGALVIGKTNLDQFATGLVGVRTPYGIGRNLFNAKLIPGGSSTGSALAVGAGIVPLSLGTDTAGSGRVPAAYSNIVGLKPSLGLVSTAGVVPACRTLDCVSVFALTVDDAMTALKAIAGADEADPYSRPRAVSAVGAMPDGVRLGVPSAGQPMFFGDKSSAAAYDAALAKLSELGANLVEIDMEPFYETARLLYEGPWVAERYLAAKSLIDTAPETLHPVTRQIIAVGARTTARATGHSKRSTRWHCRPRRPSTPSNRCSPNRLISIAGSAPTRILSICSICAGLPCRPRCGPTGRRSGLRCWRPPAPMPCWRRSAANFIAPAVCRSARSMSNSGARADSGPARSAAPGGLQGCRDRSAAVPG
jgi:allophanate hydrolase